MRRCPSGEDDEFEDEEYTLSFLVSTIIFTLISQAALLLKLLLALLPRYITRVHVLMGLPTSSYLMTGRRGFLGVWVRL